MGFCNLADFNIYRIISIKVHIELNIEVSNPLPSNNTILIRDGRYFSRIYIPNKIIGMASKYNVIGKLIIDYIDVILYM